MSNEASSGSTHNAGAQSSDLRAARAQIEAARLRHQKLVDSGHLPRAALGLPPSNPTLPGYTLLREMHRGGQGVVYLALQTSTGRQVAIKLLNRERARSGVAGLARFEREIEILSRLKHANVVTVHDCGRNFGHVYLVMDYVAGRPLDAWVDRDRTPIPETLRVFAKICDGVNAAHLRGVIHRDLKPGNIVVDDRGEPHVLDFGLAKLTQESRETPHEHAMTATGQFVGSLPWSSPEQAEGRLESLDIRTDVYSLGVVLYQLLTGRFPYPVSGRMDEVVRHIAQTDPIRPSTIQRTIDRELETIVLKCLAKEPERRYQNAGELARDIRRYLSNEPIEARRDSLAYIMAKRLARYRLAVIAATVILFAVLGALIVSVAFWRQAALQRNLAQNAAERADREADQSRAVVEFMRDVLTSVESENQGADVRLIQVLPHASKTAAQRFAAHPEQEAKVHELLGHVYFKLSLWRDAVAEHSAALALWRQFAGADDPRALIAESTRTGIALNLSNYREVEVALSALIPRMTRILGPDDRNTLAARRNLAIALLNQGRLDEAEAILVELREHPALAGDDAMQLRLAQTLIELLQWRRFQLPVGPARAASLVQQQALAREWIERSMRCNGAYEAFTLQGRAVLCRVIYDQGNYQEAVQECRALLENTSGRMSDCHNVRLWTILVLADALAHLGETDEPAELYLRRIECLRDGRSPARIPLISTMSDALPYIDRAGRAAEGETLARELEEELASLSGHGAMTFQPEIYVARFVSMQNRMDEAEPIFQTWLAAEEALPDDRARGRLHLFYGDHLIRRGQFAEAERELITSAECIGDIRRGTCEIQPDDVIIAFIDLYKAWGKPDKADEYQRVRGDANHGAAYSEPE